MMCLAMLAVLAIALYAAIWFMLGLDAKADMLQQDLYREQIQHQKCRDKLVMESIHEKASNWRRDRRSGDGGMEVNEE
jgi:hypothetical protein